MSDSSRKSDFDPLQDSLEAQPSKNGSSLLSSSETSPPFFPWNKVPALRHILGIEELSASEIVSLLDLSDFYIQTLGTSPEINTGKEAPLNTALDLQKRAPHVKVPPLLDGQSVINLFFENSTRTRTSFEMAAKRLGADVINMNLEASSLKKGETLLDTAVTLNAMHPDYLCVRHPNAGATALLAQKVHASVINGGDGAHEHPTQALLDALTIRRRKGRIEGLQIAICGDITHSRVARSNILLLSKLGARIHLIAPPTLVSSSFERMGATIYNRMEDGLKGCDVIMMLRLQKERMSSSLVPSAREYFRYYGLDDKKLTYAKPSALVMHPGPMNRGVEIATHIADDPERSAIQEQVEMGVVVRMACLTALKAYREPPLEKIQLLHL